MRQIIRFLPVVFAFAIIVAQDYSHAAKAPVQIACDLSASGKFGVDILEFPDLIDSGRGRKVPIKAFLPAGAGPFPVVVVSHGVGGNWDTNFAQDRHLASHGYAVFAVEHIGSNTGALTRSLRLLANLKAILHDANEALGRPKDISFAIDRAEEWNKSHDKLRGRLDMKHVGVMGHSFGAYTTMVVAGMRPALKWLKPTVAPGQGLGPDLRDKRVVCGVALSPQGPGEPLFIEESYASLKIPLLGITGSKDKQLNATPENRRRGYELWPPGDKYLIWLANADHTAFTDATGSNHRMAPALAREDVQPVVRAATLLFFNAYLKGDGTARKELTAAGLKPYLRGSVDTVEVLNK